MCASCGKKRNAFRQPAQQGRQLPAQPAANPARDRIVNLRQSNRQAPKR